MILSIRVLQVGTVEKEKKSTPADVMCPTTTYVASVPSPKCSPAEAILFLDTAAPIMFWCCGLARFPVDWHVFPKPHAIRIRSQILGSHCNDTD